MPELPEVETIRAQLQKYIVGKTIAGVTPYHKKSLQGNPKLVIGKKVLAAKRIGKMIVLDIAGQIDIAIHLKMSGQLLLNRNKSAVPHKHTRVIIDFKDGDQLIFNDQRIFGWVKIMKNEELKIMKYVKNLGPEPWDITDFDFFNKLQTKKKAIKVILTDQDVISGVGNIYANDALWEARIKPDKSAKAITLLVVKKLRQAIIKVLKEGIEYGGSTGGDQKYVNLEGERGSYQNHFRVYDRKGENCSRNDGGIVQKIKLGGRGTYFCPICQK